MLIFVNIILVYQLLSERKQKILPPKLITSESLLQEQLLYTILMDEKEVNLMNLSKNEVPVLCYYASDIHCNSCVDSLLNIVCRISEEYNGVNIALLARYKNKNDLNIFLRQNRFNGVVLDINNVDNAMFKSNYPLMFVYHPNKHKASEVFRPLMSDMETTKKYLHVVFEKYSIY